MKYILNTLVAVALAALCAVAIVHFRTSRTLKSQVSAMATELEQKQEQLTEAERARQRSEHQETQLLQLTGDMDKKLRAQQQALSNATAKARSSSAASSDAQSGSQAQANGNAGGLGKMLAKMMEDPDTRKLIRDQQRIMLDQLYGPLARQFGLTDAEATKFKDMLADNMMKATENATTMFGTTSSTNRTETMEKLAAAQKQSEEDVKALLGDDRYAKYKEYQVTVGERAQLNMFRQQTAGSPNAIEDAQVEQLLALMKEEKQNSPDLAALSGNQQQAQMQMLGSQEQTDKIIQAQESVNQRVYERASQVLNSGQLETFGKFQTQQLQTLKVGINMARKMMGGEEGPGK